MAIFTLAHGYSFLHDVFRLDLIGLDRVGASSSRLDLSYDTAQGYHADYALGGKGLRPVFSQGEIKAFKAGTITDLSIAAPQNGGVVFAIAGLNLDADRLFDLMRADKFAAVKALVFKGNDLIQGSHLNDQFNGMKGNDLIRCYGGLDNLNGGLGRDVLSGGLDADQFVFDTTAGRRNADRISDFDGAEDHVVLDRNVYKALAPDMELDPEQLALGLRAVQADDRLIYDQTSGRLWYDRDGTGTAKPLLICTLSKGTALSAEDIWTMA